MGFAVIGSPDDAIAQLERLEEQSGGFGCYLHMAHDWADWEPTKRSYELFARYVMPRFQALSRNREASMQWAAANRPTFMGAVGNAINQEIQKHAQERSAQPKKAS
jgi:limonene 1,2-monooxygenase